MGITFSASSCRRRSDGHKASTATVRPFECDDASERSGTVGTAQTQHKMPPLCPAPPPQPLSEEPTPCAPLEPGPQLRPVSQRDLNGTGGDRNGYDSHGSDKGSDMDGSDACLGTIAPIVRRAQETVGDRHVARREGSSFGSSFAGPGDNASRSSADISGFKGNRASKEAWASLPEDGPKFPLYVVPVAEFLHMEEASPHQELKCSGLLVEHDPLSGEAVIFVSHQWAGRHHADPDFRQLHVLKSIIHCALAGNLSINVDFFSLVAYMTKPSVRARDVRRAAQGFLWYDYFSVPQPLADRRHIVGTEAADLQKAIWSLSYYVDKSDLFIVLAPPVSSSDGFPLDYQSWKSRGWCRFERLARILSAGKTSILLARSGDSLFQVGAQDFIFDPVGCGAFGDEADRQRLGPIAVRLLQRKVQTLFDSGRMAEVRRLMALRQTLLERLSEDWEQVRPRTATCDHGGIAERFLCSTSLKLATQRVQGTTPLLLASMSGNAELVKALLKAKANVNDKESRHVPGYMIWKGDTPLHLSVRHGHLNVSSLLLDNRANPTSTNNIGSTAMHGLPFSAMVNTTAEQFVPLLLRHRADIDARTKGEISPIQAGVVFRRTDLVKSLLAARASLSPCSDGHTVLHICGIFGSGQEMTEMLIDAGLSVQDTIRYKPGTFMWLFISCFSLLYRLGFRGFFSRFGHHAPGATPLAFAVMFGNAVEVRTFLKRGSDPLMRNSAGADLVTLEEDFGTCICRTESDAGR